MIKFHSAPSEKSHRVWPLCVIVLLILFSGAAGGFYLGGNLYQVAEQIYQANQGKVVDKPLQYDGPRPMISEPYRVEGLTIPEPQPPQPAAPSEPRVNVVIERPSFTSCPSSEKLGQDICSNEQLRDIDSLIAERLNGYRDAPPYQRYLQQRQKWCDPQPTRRNRTECLIDLGEQLLREIR